MLNIVIHDIYRTYMLTHKDESIIGSLQIQIYMETIDGLYVINLILYSW